MLFIHQQIQSFLNLGVCKEYPIMAKPKFPKKSDNGKETVSPTNTPPQMSNTRVEAASAAISGTEAGTTETRTTTPRKIARKPEIVKTEPRANLVPINLEDEIRRLAYLLSEHRGFEPGHESEDWLTAESEIL